MDAMDSKINLLEKNNMNEVNKTKELFYNEYKWKSPKDNIMYFFKIRLNTNNTISFSCSFMGNKEKNNFEKCYSIVDFSNYKRFRKIEDIRDIYIYLLTMIQDNQYTFNHNNLEIELTIKSYTSSEKGLEFFLPKLFPNCKCESCGRSLSGINYLRYMHNRNTKNEVIFPTDINNTSTKEEIQNKSTIEKIMEEIEALKKENCIKNEQIKNLQKDYLDQNQKLFKENQALKNQINKYKKNEIFNRPVLSENQIKTDLNNAISDSNSNILSPNKTQKKFKLATRGNPPDDGMFSIDPAKLQYQFSITKKASAKGVNNVFEVFTSIKDGKKYLISKSGKDHNIDIFSLTDNKKILNLKYWIKTTEVTMVRYFCNYKGKKEYLISADTNKKVVIWDISNNFDILRVINTEYQDANIYSCYLFFDDFENNFLFTSCGLNKYKKNDTNYTKMYSLKDGKFIKNIIDSNDNNTYFLLIWYNEIDKFNYLIELCEKQIVITNFNQNSLYAKLYKSDLKVLKYYSGFIYSKENKKNYLCCSTSNGLVITWDLINKSCINNIQISQVELYNIIQWNQKYAIIAGGSTKRIIVFDLDEFKEVNNINTNHRSNVNCVKKINHPKYGEILLSSGNDHKIKLYFIKENQNSE